MRMRSDKAVRCFSAAIGTASVVFIVLTVAVTFAIKIASTETGPALPGVSIDPPKTTEYCLGLEPPYWFCFDL